MTSLENKKGSLELSLKTKQCSYCSKDIGAQGHHHHEKFCRKRNNRLSLQMKIVKIIGPKCKFCFCHFNEKNLKNHESKCRAYEKFISPDLSCKFCSGKSPNIKQLKRHIERKHFAEFKAEKNMLEMKISGKAGTRGNKEMIPESSMPETDDKIPEVKKDAKSNDRSTDFLSNDLCLICDQRFTTSQEALDHIKSIHREILPNTNKGSENLNKCDQCGERFKLVIGLKKHKLKCAMNEEPFLKKCGICKDWIENQSFEKHYLSCTNTNFSKVDPTNENEHMKDSYELNETRVLEKLENPARSEEKLDSTKNESNQIKTIQSKSDENDEIFELCLMKKCFYCGEMVSEQCLNSHITSCINVRKIECHICHEIFQTKQNLDLHIQQRHDNVIITNDIENHIPLFNNSYPFNTVPSHSRLMGDRVNKEINPNPVTSILGNKDVASCALITAEVDPKLVTKLYECPICLGKLAFLADAQYHVAKFHRINEENQKRMGMEIKEYFV